MHQGGERFFEGGTGLRVTPVIDHSHLLDTGDRATRGTRFRSVILMLEVLPSVLFEWNARITSLLRAVVH